MLTVSRALSINELEFYVRWLDYIPAFWEFNRILEKKVKNLTSDELEKLIEINNDKSEALFIKKFINKVESKCKNKNGRMLVNISVEENEKLSNIIKRFSSEDIVKSKLSEAELEIIYNCTKEEELEKLDNEYALEYARIIFKNRQPLENQNTQEDNSKTLKKVIV